MAISSDPLTRSKDSYCKAGKHDSLRREIFSLLEENPLLPPREICRLMGISHKKYHNYVSKTKSEWNHYYKNEVGSKCSNFHRSFYGVKLEKELSDILRSKLVFSTGAGCFGGYGWQLSKAKNRFLVTRKGLGRVVWFETGLVLLYVKKPANLGKAKQLFCKAFLCEDFTDFNTLRPLLDKIRFHYGHYPFETGVRLPKMVIKDFRESHGIEIKVGDTSHPEAVEVIASNPIVEVIEKIDKIELFLQKFASKFFDNSPQQPSSNSGGNSHYVV